MQKKYKQIVCILLVNALFPVGAQSLEELNQLRLEYERFQKMQVQQQSIEDQLDILDPLSGLPQKRKITPYKKESEEEDSVEISLKHFGYDFFTRRDTIAFWESLPTPANYLLGPGDELVILLWGETQLRQIYTISRDGKIYDPKVGLLNLMGKTIEEGERYMLDQFGRVYATLKGRNPTTYMDISLGKLRSINVNFVGEVSYPGVYPIHPFSTVITGLIQSGGVNKTGSLRNIIIKRDGKFFANVDLYDYLIKGNLPENIQLRNQDIVVVPVRLSTVIVDSAVVRPGIYESKEGETVKNIIDYAGGLNRNASSSIGLKRILPINERKSGQSDTENYYIDYTNSKMITIQNGDIIIVRSIFKTINQVEIIGQVKTPGFYHYYNGMKLKNLVELGGGFMDTTFRKSIYKNNGELVRRDPNSRYEKVININLNNLFNGDSSSNVELQNLDRFVVHANVNFFEKKNVQILGEVNIPGSYPVLKDGESLQSFIDRSGGFSSKAFTEGIEIFRDSLRVAWENTNVPLSPGDSVVIKERPGAVHVTGEVYNPGLIEYQEKKSLSYYINSSGGVTNEGNKNNIIVIYANGVVKPKKFMNSPKIRDGATIIVNKKEIKKAFDITAFTTSTLSIISTTITILVLSKQLNPTQ